LRIFEENQNPVDMHTSITQVIRSRSSPRKEVMQADRSSPRKKVTQTIRSSCRKKVMQTFRSSPRKLGKESENKS
jgi:hypothetical protein